MKKKELKETVTELIFIIEDLTTFKESSEHYKNAEKKFEEIYKKTRDKL